MSRSSALATKAAGYPLSLIAAELGLGIPHDKIENPVHESHSAWFEPRVDHVVVSTPRWDRDLKTFSRVSRLLVAT